MILKLVLGVVFLLIATALLADPLNQWTWRFPYPQGNSLYAVTYGGGKFVAVGANGTIITSTDGYNWTNQTYGAFPNLQGVAYAAGTYAAVGDGGVIVVSSNAVTWTQVASVTGNSFHGIAGNSSWYSNGLPQFLAVGDAGTTVKCLNNTNWSVVSSAITNGLFRVTFATNYSLASPFPNFIVVGNSGTVASYSTSGFSQRPHSQFGIASTNNLYAVASSANGVTAAVGDLNQNPWTYNPHTTNEILYSINSGFRWTPQLWVDGLDQNGNSAFWFPSLMFILHGAAFGTNGFVAVGDTGYTLEFCYPGVVFTSTNGSSWVEQQNLTSENSLYGCTYGNGLYGKSNSRIIQAT